MLRGSSSLTSEKQTASSIKREAAEEQQQPWRSGGASRSSTRRRSGTPMGSGSRCVSAERLCLTRGFCALTFRILYRRDGDWSLGRRHHEHEREPRDDLRGRRRRLHPLGEPPAGDAQVPGARALRLARRHGASRGGQEGGRGGGGGRKKGEDDAAGTHKGRALWFLCAAVPRRR